jgi:hypothetical protein
VPGLSRTEVGRAGVHPALALRRFVMGATTELRGEEIGGGDLGSGPKAKPYGLTAPAGAIGASVHCRSPWEGQRSHGEGTVRAYWPAGAAHFDRVETSGSSGAEESQPSDQLVVDAPGPSAIGPHATDTLTRTPCTRNALPDPMRPARHIRTHETRTGFPDLMQPAPVFGTLIRPVVGIVLARSVQTPAGLRTRAERGRSRALCGPVRPELAPTAPRTTPGRFWTQRRTPVPPSVGFLDTLWVRMRVSQLRRMAGSLSSAAVFKFSVTHFGSGPLAAFDLTVRTDRPRNARPTCGPA